MVEEVKPEERTLREGNISLILDSYEDIFSDFDPRPYGEKALSDDFLNECRKAARDKDEHNLELRLLVPRMKRSAAAEETIRHRLKNHFQKHHHEHEKDIRAIKLRGGQFFAIGVACMLISAYISSLGGSGIGYHLLIVAFEPAGWFAFWVGLEQIFFGPKEKEPEHSFYAKMVHVEVEFFSY
jgi:hypothetical protein